MEPEPEDHLKMTFDVLEPKMFEHAYLVCRVDAVGKTKYIMNAMKRVLDVGRRFRKEEYFDPSLPKKL